MPDRAARIMKTIDGSTTSVVCHAAAATGFLKTRGFPEQLIIYCRRSPWSFEFNGNEEMLIDASHPEETRVLVVNKNKLEDFDVEVESRRPLKGNIYLAKVTRVEPSLQAAFVDFGGNRHGFLAFNEIHPDYYQIPVADREALMAEARAEAEAARAAEDDEAEPEDGEAVETLGGDDSEEIEARRPVKLRRNYKIWEVIKRRQILLIQVVKEERGTKGAALTTFLSLAGRYCVLMPNTDRGGGISRKSAVWPIASA